MKKGVKIRLLIAMIGITVLIFRGCMFLRSLRIPPSLFAVERQFQKDKHQLYIIQEYLMSTNYKSIVVKDDCRTMLVEVYDSLVLEEIQIDDESVTEALFDIREKGYTIVHKSGTTIQFMLWSAFIIDCGCGIYYDPTGGSPSILYVTETKPLSEDGWNYYIEDYNKWRSSTSEE